VRGGKGREGKWRGGEREERDEKEKGGGHIGGKGPSPPPQKKNPGAATEWCGYTRWSEMSEDTIRPTHFDRIHERDRRTDTQTYTA